MGVEFGLGTLLALLTFLRSEVGGRHTKDELLRVMDAAGKTEQFREWLRQKDQAELIQQIEASKNELLSELASMGGRLDLFASDVFKISGDLEGRFRDLNDRIRPPVLSTVSLPTRPSANAILKGRDRELAWLSGSTSDALVSGQPGSGKTELLQTFATDHNARFLISDNPDEAAAALLATVPAIVIVDDAGTKRDLIIRLRHLRTEHGLQFRIIGTCWPFDRPMLYQALAVDSEATLDLEGLPRKVIAEIITDIATAQRVNVSDQFIRVVAKQARGMPGLAASLTLATIAATGEALVSGELLLKDLGPFLLRVAGPSAIQMLGAFACGGKEGISFTALARNLGKDILQIMVDSQRVALAGVLEQTGPDTLCVQPEFLRSALLKETFFRSDGISLPWDICDALINSSKNSVLGYLELIHARGRAAAAVPTDRLREVTTRLNDYRLWDAMAALDPANCDWVINSVPALSAAIKRTALLYNPSRMIPILLGFAVNETRPLNAFPEADLRLLEEWISQAWTDAVQRRRKLFDAAISWLKGGGSPAIALSAVRLSFGLVHQENDSDPADPRTFRLREALIPLDAARNVFAQWEILIQELSSLKAVHWPGVTAIVDNWLRCDRRLRGGVSEEYAEFLLSSAIQMIGDLIPLASDNQAALRWIYFRAEDSGMLIDPCPVAPEFLALFPEEPHRGDWEENERRQIQAAQELALAWKDRPIRDVIEELTRWEKQAETVQRVWPQRIPFFASKLAEIKSLTAEELAIVIERFSDRAAMPFIETAFTQGRLEPAHFQRILKRPDLHGLLLHYTLTGKTPEFYQELESQIPKWKPQAEGLCHRGEVPIEILQKLLHHPDSDLRRDVALQMFRAGMGIPLTLLEEWRSVIIKSLTDFADEYDGNHPYDLKKLLDFDTTIAPAVLDGILSSGTQVHGFIAGGLMSQVVVPLGKEERRVLLHRCKHLVYSPLPLLLVGRDEDLFREFLNIPELADSYSQVLAGDPNEGNWPALAKIALVAGHSHRDISYAVNSGGFTWNGGLSTYYQQLVERFERLRQSPDPDIQRIAEEGVRWSKASRDSERRSERKEEIHGWD